MRTKGLEKGSVIYQHYKDTSAKFYIAATFSFNPLDPNINVHILRTFLFTKTMALTRRICLTFGSFVNW